MGMMDVLFYLMADGAVGDGGPGDAGGDGGPGDAGGEGDDTDAAADDTAGGGTGATPDEGFPTWMEQNKGDLKKNEKLKDFSTINDLSQAYIELADKKEITIPKDDAGEDAWKAFYKKIGRPDSYEIPEEVTKRKEYEGIDGVYDRLNLTEKQAEGLNEFLKGSADRVLESEKKERSNAYETAIKTARKIWGVDYDDNMKYVTKFVNSFGGEPLKRALQQTGADNRFVVLDAFNKVSKLLGPGYFTTGVIDTPEPPRGLQYKSEI